MALTFRRLAYISRVFPRFRLDPISRMKPPASLAANLQHQQPERYRRSFCSGAQVCQKAITVWENAEILTLIKSKLSEVEGPSHQWINCMDQNCPTNKDGIFLVLVNTCFGEPASVGYRETVVMFEKVKLLQQRYPMLNIFGLFCDDSLKSVDGHAKIIQKVMEEYITFPILILDKNITRMTNGACCLLFEGSTNRLLNHWLDLDLEDVVKVIEKFDVHPKTVPEEDGAFLFQTSFGETIGQNNIIMDPYASSPFRNLLLYYPGSVAADEDGNRLFISDSNHHRVIITDGNGKVIDCIGSSPGFEDGEFESAKLLRPSALFYDDVEDCLYFVDSENNAIRRANMENRMLVTVFPASVQKTSGIWSWILDKLGLASEVEVKSEEFNVNAFTLPWYLLKSEENEVIVINRSFEISWILDMRTWEIKEVKRGIQNIMENYGQMIEEKVNLLRDTREPTLPLRLNSALSKEGIPYACLMSSVVNFHYSMIFCDSAGHRVLKYDKKSKTSSDIKFSNLKVLGLPYWFVSPLETDFNRYIRRPWKELHHQFSVLPGRCDIRVNVDIPLGMELLSPLNNECIWRQARGPIAELSGFEEVTTATEKVGVAQQWFDELDNLAFAKSGNQLSGAKVEEQSADGRLQDMQKVHFDCAVNISPGMGEVVVSAVLYLKLHKTQDSQEMKLEALKILNPRNHGEKNHSEEALISLLLKGGRDLEDIIFMKPLHLRIRLDCADHPTATTHKETILTDTALEISVLID